MTCLGERISSLTDGELGHNARDRALAHIASCPDCRAALDAERAIKARLTRAATPVPSPGLTVRLLRLAEAGDPLPPPTPRMPGTRRPTPLPAPGRPDTAHRAPRVTRPAHLRSRRTRRTALASVGALSMLGIALGGALFLGSTTEPPSVRPAVARFSLEHAGAAQLPLREPAIDAVTATFGTAPATPEERSR